MELRKPKPKTITTQEDGDRTYILSKFPAVAGREIVTKYPISNVPKIGEYEVSKATMFQLMGFVGVDTGGGNVIRLETEALIDNHVPDYETLLRLEWAMLEYNCSFFANGLRSDFFENLRAKAPTWISQMLTALSAQSSQAAKQPSES